MTISAGLGPGVGFEASCFAGSQGGGVLGAGWIFCRWSVRQCGIVEGVLRVWAK
jgi:hypothetical protein